MSNLNEDIEVYYDCKGDRHLVVELMDNTNGELFMHDFGVRYQGTADNLCNIIAYCIDKDLTLDAHRALGVIRARLVAEHGDEAREAIDNYYEVLWS